MRTRFLFNVLAVLSVTGFFSCDLRPREENMATVPLYSLADHRRTGVDFQNRVKETLYMNRLFYEYYYNGGGVAIGDFNNDKLPDLYFISNLESNRLFLNQGHLRFKDVTPQANVQGRSAFPTGVTTVDINADGLLDIYICSSGKFRDPNKRRNELYVNLGSDNGVPKFVEVAAEYNLDIDAFSTQASFFDYDRDGDLDMFLINHDVNTYGDELLEAYMQTQGSLSGERLYQNKDGKFFEVTEAAGIVKNRLGFGLGVAVGDTNNDGWPDIYVSNDFSGKDHFYINNTDGTFSEKVNESMRHISFFSMGNDMADYNNDGWLDIVTVDMVSEDNYGIKTSMSGMNPDRFYKHVNLGLHRQYMYNTLQTNMGNIGDGTPYFSETAQLAGISNTDWSWAPLFLDMDNDGFQDIFVSNGVKRDFRNNDFIAYHKRVRDSLSQFDIIDRDSYINDIMSKMPTRRKSNYFFLNDTDLGFSKEGGHWGMDSLKTSSNGASYADLDNDGDLDIVVNNMDDYAHIYENHSNEINDNYFLKVTLKGPPGNVMGIGTKIKLVTGETVQVREQYVSRGFQSAVGEILHFGLGKHKNIDRVEAYWPNGYVEVLKNVTADETIVFDYENAAPKINIDTPYQPIFTDVTQEMVNHAHVENTFDDFQRESLLPHKMSSQGPALAVGDVNSDGLDDFFIGGSSGHEGNIFLQGQDGSFSAQKQSIFQRDRQYEDVGATFLDADSDGDLDLFVVSGGNENPIGSNRYQDRLYENQDGVFIHNKNALPVLTSSGSCVNPIDLDADGDLDLFVGGRQVPGKYPYPADSSILINESKQGKITFVEATEEMAPGLRALGMVTDAAWVDINGDGLLDLVVVGEWMPVTIFENRGGYFENATEKYGMSEQTGWWNCVTALDYDNDGDMDLFAGNLGLNYKYKATTNEPFEVYAEDFDDSGSLDIVLGYYNGGQLFPLRGRQCSSEQMPFIKKKFESYDAFGKATLDEVYGSGNLEDAVHYTAKNFASTFFENKGGTVMEAHDLPKWVQLSSVNSMLIEDFDFDGQLDILLAGNLYGSEIETPRNDGGYGFFLKGLAEGAFEPIPSFKSGLFLDGEVRALRQLTSADGEEIIMAVKNNSRLQFLAPTANKNDKNLYR